MTIFAVYERDRPEGTERFPHVVPEKFSWFAALLPALFALMHRLWLLLIVYFVAVAALVVLSSRIGPDAGFWLYVVLAAWIGFAAPGLRAWGLQRRGHAHRLDVIATAEDMAEVEALRLRGAVR